MASHFGLDFNRVEDLMTVVIEDWVLGYSEKRCCYLAVVNSDDGTNHFWDDDHVPEVGLYYCGLFVGRSFFLGLSQFLDQTQGFAFEAAVETPASAGMDNLTGVYINQEGNERREMIRTSTSCKEGEVSKNQDHSRSRGTNLLVVEIQELLELNATVREGSECPFFLELGGNSGVGSLRHGRYLGCGSEA
jgi:hypothetical protein